MKTALATLLSVVLLGGLADGADAAKHSFKPIEKKSRALIFDPEGVNANAVRKAHLKLRVHRKTVERRIRARRVRRALAASAESLDTSAEDLDSSGERAVGGVAVKVGRPKKSRGGVLVIAEEPPRRSRRRRSRRRRSRRRRSRRRRSRRRRSHVGGARSEVRISLEPAGVPTRTRAPSTEA